MNLIDAPDLRIEPPKTAQTLDAPGGLDSGFTAGRALAVIDPLCLVPPDFSGSLRQRLALRAATSGARRQRLITNEHALRDLWLLRTSDSDPAPRAGSIASFALLPAIPIRYGSTL